MHLYKHLPLFGTGLVLAAWLIGLHLLMLVKPAMMQGFLQKFPRNQWLGQIILGLGLAWFWLLIAPEGMGKLSALAMNLGEFDKAKPILRVLVVLAVFLVSLSVRDFLAVRALGLLGLMVASPLLEGAFLKAPDSRLLVPIFAYALLTASMFWVGMPYVFRDAVTWATAKPQRWTGLAMAGLGYGIATLVCALAFWRGY
jgi:hypothetical protein